MRAGHRVVVGDGDWYDDDMTTMATVTTNEDQVGSGGVETRAVGDGRQRRGQTKINKEQ